MRREAKLSQQKLAERAEVAKQVISNIETGSVLPSLKTLNQIAGALSVSLHTIIEKADNRADPARTKLEAQIAVLVRSMDPAILEVSVKVLQAIAKTRRDR